MSISVQPPDRPAVLITGAAQRLGATLASRFGENGWHVVIHFRESAEEAESLAATLPSAETVGFDLADPPSLERAISALAPRLRNWRTVINCASVFEYDGASCLDLQVLDRAMRTNAAGPMLLAQAFLANSQTPDGRCIINVLDQKLGNPNPDFFSYTMSKAALACATEMLAMAHEDAGTRIYGLSPGAMLPSFDQAEAEHEVSGRMNLLRRLTKPDELADAALFLASGALQSGQTLVVDSGQHLLRQDRDVLFLAREQA